MRQTKIGNKNCLGRRLSEETKEKISQSNRGKCWSEETRKKIESAQHLRWESARRTGTTRLGALPKYAKQDTYTKLEQILRDELENRGIQYFKARGFWVLRLREERICCDVMACADEIVAMIATLAKAFPFETAICCC